MADDVTLSSIQRYILNQRQDIAAAQAESSQRLATGRRISSIGDGPVDYYRASALTNRADGLLAAKSDIRRGIDTLAASQAGSEAINRLADQARGLANAVQADPDQRAEYAARFDEVRQQIDNLAGDTSFLGTNLLDNPADSLRVSLSEEPGTEFTVQGEASDSQALSIGSASTDYNDFATQADIDNAIAAVDSAVQQVRSNSETLGSNAAILEVREQFAEDVAATLETGAGQLVNADLNEEAARSLSASVRDSLSAESLRISSQSDQAVVDLVSNS